MKTEHLRMQDITLGPFTTLILFSAPERATVANLQPTSTGNASAFTAAMLHESAWRVSDRCVAAMQEA